MKCPFCGCADDRVLETRIQKEGETIRRRRECLQCSGRFSTLETLVLQMPMVKKKDGRLETFNKNKVLSGVKAACQKRNIPLERVHQLVDTVALMALQCGQREIPGSMIGAWVLQELKSVDHVAFVRFASVHRTFNDLTEFLKNLENDPKEI